MFNNYKKGFAPLVLVLVLAVAVAIGGGTYYAAKKAKKPENQKTENGIKGQLNATTSAKASVGLKRGSLRDIIIAGKTVMCTVSNATATSSVTGTTYVSGSMMRGDFMVKSQTGVLVDSHMIRNGNDIYFWSGTQGGRMNIDILESQNGAQSQGTINWNQSVDYKCEDWTKDPAKFTVPTGVNIVDLSAMFKGQVNVPIKVGQ